MGKIVKLKNKKTGVRVYPVTATSAVVDANSGERLNDTLQNKVEEAPMDGNQYVRINGTWGIAQVATSTKEKCIITLASNQGESDAASLYGATVKVTDVDSAEVYHNGVWDGTEIALEFAPGVNYKVEVGDVADYATPESKTLTALDFNVRNLVMMYNTELVSVTLSADNGVSVIGQQVTINGSTSTWNGTAITKKIAYGVSYEVSVNGKAGYHTPDKQSIVSSEVARNITLVYSEFGYGIYIQDVNGNLYDEASWNESLIPECIALISESYKFGVALEEFDSMQFGVYTYNSLTAISDEINAKLDFNGRNNTLNILNVNSNALPAKECNEYIFPSGKNGYLPSAGEMRAIHDNIEQINKLMEKVGGVLFNSTSYDEPYWTSTYGGQINDNEVFWRIMIEDGSLEKLNPYNSGAARACVYIE